MPSPILFHPGKPLPGASPLGSGEKCGDILACVTTSSNSNPAPSLSAIKIVFNASGRGRMDVQQLPRDSNELALRPKIRSSLGISGMPASRTAMRAASRRNADERYASSPRPPTTPPVGSPKNRPQSPPLSTPKIICSIALPLPQPPAPLTASSVMIPTQPDESSSLVLVFQKQDTLVRFMTLVEFVRTRASHHTAGRRSVAINKLPSPFGEEGCDAVPTDRIIPSPISKGSSPQQHFSPKPATASSPFERRTPPRVTNHHNNNTPQALVAGPLEYPGTPPTATASPYVYMAQTLREQSYQSQAKFDATLESYRRAEERRRRDIDHLFEERDRRRAAFLAKRNMLRDDLNIPTYTNHHYPDEGEEPEATQAWKSFVAMSDAVGRKWERETVDVDKLLLHTAGRRASLASAMSDETANYYSRVMKADLNVLSSRPAEHEDPMAALLRRIEADSVDHKHPRSASTKTAGSYFESTPEAQVQPPPVPLSHSPTPPPYAAPAASEELAAALEAEARLLAAVSLEPLPRGIPGDTSAPTPELTPTPVPLPVQTPDPISDAANGAAPTDNAAPAGWKEMKDPKSGRTYYYRASDKKTVWSMDEARKLGSGTAASESSVPAGWKEMKDPKSGRTYYYRASDKKTVWSMDEARKLGAGSSAADAPAENAVPAGWKEMKDPKSGRTYYYRASDKKTVWSMDEARKLGSSTAASESSVPAGWKEMKDPKSGRTYYYRASDKKTVWSIDEARKLGS